MRGWAVVAVSVCVALLARAGDEAKVAPPPPTPTPPSTNGSETAAAAAGVRSDEAGANKTAADNETSTEAPTPPPVLPDKDSEEDEHRSSMAIFFILFIIVLSILLVHILIVTKFHYVPESLAIVVLGALIGFVLSYSKDNSYAHLEAFSPNAFFLIFLPPIIFESGYNLHKGNFFANIGSILSFAIVGTGISAAVVGSGLYVLGRAGLVYELTAVECFAFGSMISAVDPVATLAIFQALNVDQLLYMLVFGESVLNDAVAIVLTATVLELNSPHLQQLGAWAAVRACVVRFALMFFGSAALGVVAGLLSALLLKHVDLRRTPSLEFAILLVFAYLPYGLAEGLHLSGIMAILFCGIVMSHYTHFSLSPMTQITMQQTFRTLAFVAETCVFAYLGMAIFTFPLSFKPVLVVWSIILCLVGRAVNIFPLSHVANLFRETQITRRTQFVMWFSGLRGAVAFALSLHVPFNEDDVEKRSVFVATTLAVVLFTVLGLGGSTMPLLNLLNKWQAEQSVERQRRRRRRRRRRERDRRVRVTLSKTEEMNLVFEPDASYSEYTESEERLKRSASLPSTSSTDGAAGNISTGLRDLVHLDALYVRPFFVRKFTQKEKRESTRKLTDLALQWYKAAQEESDEEDTHFDADMTLPQLNGRAEPPPSTSADVILELSSSDDESDGAPLVPR